MPAELTPSGSDVVSSGVSGLGDFFRQLGGIAVSGISRKVDLDLQQDHLTPDTSQTAPLTNTNVSPPGVADVFANFGPLQWGGLLLAGGLAWGLATGKFR
jgi:hypothetical protein